MPIGLSNGQQAILMFLAFFLPPFAAWFGAGAPTDHTGLALLGSAVIGGASGGIIAWTKELLGGQGPISTTSTTTTTTTQPTPTAPPVTTYGQWTSTPTLTDSVYGKAGTTIYMRNVYVNGIFDHQEVTATKPS